MLIEAILSGDVEAIKGVIASKIKEQLDEMRDGILAEELSAKQKSSQKKQTLNQIQKKSFSKNSTKLPKIKGFKKSGKKIRVLTAKEKFHRKYGSAKSKIKPKLHQNIVIKKKEKVG